MSYCIPPELINKVKEIVDTASSSIERNKKLTELLGADNAKEVNIAFEKSTLLSNQKTAIDKFIDSLTNVGQEQKQAIKNKIAERLANRTDTIQQKELLAIAQDIYKKKYRLEIPLEDVSKLNQAKIKVDSLDNAQGRALDNLGESEYAKAVVEFRKVAESIVSPNNEKGFVDTAKSILDITKQRFEGKNAIDKSIEGVKLASEVATSALYKSVQASMDLSYSLRQGFKVLTTNPKIWRENWIKAFEPFKKISSQAEQQLVADKFMVRLVSSPFYEQAIKSKLAIGVIEDFFPTTLAEKIPVLGNLFKSSNEAFTIFSQGSRMSLFEDFVKKTELNGTEITPELMKDFAKVANSITGRGNLGVFESVSGPINKIFYSGRYMKAAVDTFMMPFDMSLSKEARAEAMKVARNNLATIATLMATASLFTDVEWNPQSSKFGKMRVGGKSYVDLTGGLGSYITLATRIATQKSKSATTNKITPLNSGAFGSRSTFDVALDFFTNKLAPAPSTVVSFLKGKDFSGKKPTIASSATNLATPITIKNIYDSFTNNDTSTALLASMFDILGASQTDYNKFKKQGK